MPVTRVPIINRFGVISTSYHEELLKHSSKSINEVNIEKPRKPLLITKEFIKKFNDTENPEEKKHLQDQAKKMLFRCKRRLGLSSLGVGSHVDLPAAWTEAVYLAQCKGEVQEEALNMLCTSLDHASLNYSHLTTLFFIAESVLYRICCDASQKSYLYSSEIKLTKIGFLTFLRLFVYHLYGNLEGFEEQLIRLQPYLYALYFCGVSYSKYPNILSSLNFIQKTGEVICFPQRLNEARVDPNTKQDLDFPDMKDISKPYSKKQEVSHLLWHCIVVWSCVQHQRSQLNEVLEHLLMHKEQLKKKLWLDSVLGLFILGDAAKLNISCLKVLMNLGKDFISSCMSPQKQEENKDNDFSWQWIIAYIYTTVLGDICLHATTSSLRKIAFMGFNDCENLSKYLELRNTKSTEPVELKEGNFLDLLKYFSSQISDNCCQMTWTVYYGLVYNLVKMTRELCGDERQDGLRNLLWKTLQRVKEDEKDKRILNAVDIAEAELNDTINPFICSTVKAPRNQTFFKYVGCRLACALSKLFLPPVVPSSLLLKRHEKEQKQMTYQTPKQYQMEKKVIHIFFRERHPEEELVRPYPDIVTRADMALRTIVEKQWEKDQQIRLREEEILLAQEMKQKRKEELERYRAMMKRREEKIHKTTKPYVLPGQTPSEESEPMSSSSSNLSPEEIYCIGKQNYDRLGDT
ncbi:transmembrane protein 232 [Dromiciops gliroides]|uniref:transmembrane protein 232 n=1 Tax=Dromiciops gliroides TaxID=33562 RepID=UPI001CC6E177|nr:transmembrane protein 232 [Dromiciops gliroides]